VKKTAAAILALALVFCALTGCFFQSGEELYKLPQPPEEYLELQRVIENVLDSGAEYLAPTSGSNRQSVQLRDLDGDGVDEAIAFFRNQGEVRPLKIYVFRMAGEVYETVGVIEGDGTSIDSINYVDLDGDGVLEILAGWRISEDVLKALSVYALSDSGELQEILSANYGKYTVGDVDGDGNDEIIVMRLADDSHPPVVEYLDYDHGRVTRTESRLSAGISSVSRVRFSRLEDGTIALYVTSILDDGNLGGGTLVTDVFIERAGNLVNVTMDAESGVSTGTVRGYAVYAQDIDSDGVVEIPRPEIIPGGSGSESLLRITWYSVVNSQKSTSIKLVTLHDFTDGWYMTLPMAWQEDLAASREENTVGQSTVTLSALSGDGAEQLPLLRIYTTTLGRVRGTTLATSGTVTYSYDILEGYDAWEAAVPEEAISASFHTIVSEWSSSNIW